MDWKQISKTWKEHPDWPATVAEWMDQKASGMHLLEQVQARDRKNQRLIRVAVNMLSIATALLTITVFLNPAPDLFTHYSTRATAALEILAFTLFIPYGYKKLMEYQANLESLSLSEFLAYGEKRFAFWRKDSWILIPYIILIGAALNFSIMGRYNENGFSWTVFFWLNGSFLLVMGIAFLLSWLNWRKKQLPILQEIRSIRTGFSES